MPNVRSETLVEKQLEVILYDYRPDKEDVILGNFVRWRYKDLCENPISVYSDVFYCYFFYFVGEFVVNLQNALLDNAMIWYELESPNHSKASKSPRSSISDTGKGGLRSQVRSVSGIDNNIIGV